MRSILSFEIYQIADSTMNRVLLPSNAVPKHYKLDLTPDLEKLEYLGSSDTNKIVE